jgi:hypothetical protein
MGALQIGYEVQKNLLIEIWPLDGADELRGKIFLCPGALWHASLLHAAIAGR